MSSVCLFVLKDIKRPNIIKKELNDLVTKQGYGLCFTPSNSLLLEKMVEPGPCDFIFEPTDSPVSNDTSMLVGYSSFGITEEPPLIARMCFIQDLTVCCMRYTDEINLFISDDNAYWPDYSTFHVSPINVAKVLYREYIKMGHTTPFLPNLHLIIT